MEREQTTIRFPADVKKFIALIQQVDEKKQMGIYLMLEGLNLIADKEKKRLTNR